MSEVKPRDSVDLAALTPEQLAAFAAGRERDSALLERSGVPATLRPFALYGAALLDLVLGIATVVLRRRRLLWWAQIALILVYTAVISVRLPEFWLHPYGPLLKNLPMLAALVALLQLERREGGQHGGV